MDFSQHFVLTISLLLVLSILATVFSARFGAPLLLVFLVLGMLLGTDGLGIEFDNVEMAFRLSTIALALILFDGGLQTQRNSFRVGLKPALSLATFGVLITTLITGAFAAWILNLPPLLGLLMGALIASTDAAAVFGLLHTAKIELKQRVAATLEIESGSNDPMAIFLTILLIELILQPGLNWQLYIVFELIQQMGLGLILGLAGGWLAVQIINRVQLTSGLYPLMTLGFALSLFETINALGGSGFLGVYIAGIFLGNARVQSAINILRFHNGMAWLSQIGLFLMLGLLVVPTHLLSVMWQASVIALILFFVARPIAVWASLALFNFHWKEQAFISWIGLRGAVPIILAMFPLLAGVEHAEILFSVAFFVVLLSLIIQGWSLPLVAKWLRVDIPPAVNKLQRTELDIPNHPNYELVGYKISEDSPALGVSPLNLELPEGIMPAILIRNQGLIGLSPECRLELNDTLYLAAPTQHLNLLDRIFVHVHMPERWQESAFFGEFVLNGQSDVQALSQLYGIELPQDAQGHSLDSWIHTRFPAPVVGDRIQLDAVTLVVREMLDNTCNKVGLKFNNDDFSK